MPVARLGTLFVVRSQHCPDEPQHQEDAASLKILQLSRYEHNSDSATFRRTSLSTLSLLS